MGCTHKKIGSGLMGENILRNYGFYNFSDGKLLHVFKILRDI